MSLKSELITWGAALKAYDKQEYEEALEVFSTIADSSKILTNMGLIHATLGEHDLAVQQFIKATNLDRYLAVAYFQCGVSNFLLAKYELACQYFEETIVHLRGQQLINYEQLGLNFRLYLAEALYNRGLSQIELGRIEEGLRDLREASQNKAIAEHNVIDEAIRYEGRDSTVFSVPVGILYRPSESKLKNAIQKDFIGKATLIATRDPVDISTEFSGVVRLKKGIASPGVFVEPLSVNTVDSSKLINTPTRLYPSRKLDDSEPMGLEQPRAVINKPVNRVPKIITNNLPATPTYQSPDARMRSTAGRLPAIVPPPARNGPHSADTKSLLSRRYTFINEEEETRSTDNFLDSYITPSRTRGPPLPRTPRLGRANSQNSRSSSRAESIQWKRNRLRSPRSPNHIMAQSISDEEGYFSGEYDVYPLERVKIRVKFHGHGQIRGMMIKPDISYGTFMDQVSAKFDKDASELSLKFSDEEGNKITLRDESDFDLAIETAKLRARDTHTTDWKLDIWCT